MDTAPSVTKSLSKQHWLRQLNPLELPADPVVKASAIHKLHTQAGNADNVANILMADPALVLRIVISANKALMSTGNELKSLSHAISLLGVPTTEQLLRGAPEYARQADPIRLALHRQFSISRHAACQIHGWCRYHPQLDERELQLATLLHRAPLWVLWYQAPELMAKLQNIQHAHQGSRHEVHEKSLLGCTIQSLAAMASRQWHLPTLTQTSWYPSERGTARQWVLLGRIIPEQASQALEKFPELQRLTRHCGLSIALANRLAEETDWDWYSRRTLRLQHILSVSLCVPLPQAIALTHQLAAAASRAFALPDTLSPASQLLSFYQRWESEPAPSQNAEPASPEPPNHQETSATPATEPETPVPAPLAAFIEQLQQQPQVFNDLHALFNRSVTTLCEDLGFERASASLLNGKSQQLRTYYSSGCKDSPGLRQFRHSLKNGDLFTKLFQRPLSLRLHQGNYSQIWSLLPGGFKQACGADQFVMMSIFVNRKPLALLYADRGNSNGTIDDNQYQHFKKLCHAISHCLSQRTAQKL